MIEVYRAAGSNGVVASIHEHDATPGALDYGLQSADGTPVAGALGLARSRHGWGDMIVSGPTEVAGPSRILTTVLPNGDRLLVGDDLRRITAVDGLVVRSFTLAFLGVLILGAAGGYLLRRDMQRRIASITNTAQAIIDGDLGRRVPLGDGDEELAQLSRTLNRMLDRIAGLMDNLRQVSSDVAHELRTPLTRLRQRLENALAAAAAGASADRMGLEGALDEFDEILATFAALLRIAQVEAGARKAAFRPVELGEVTRKVVEAFRPSAEDAGVDLSCEIEPPAWASGDGELITQMLANLVENALTHAREGGWARVVCRREPGGAIVLAVLDGGPGVPDEEREKLFTRFRRTRAESFVPRRWSRLGHGRRGRQASRRGRGTPSDQWRLGGPSDVSSPRARGGRSARAAEHQHLERARQGRRPLFPGDRGGEAGGRQIDAAALWIDGAGARAHLRGDGLDHGVGAGSGEGDHRERARPSRGNIGDAARLIEQHRVGPLPDREAGDLLAVSRRDDLGDAIGAGGDQTAVGGDRQPCRPMTPRHGIPADHLARRQVDHRDLVGFLDVDVQASLSVARRKLETAADCDLTGDPAPISGRPD